MSREAGPVATSPAGWIPQAGAAEGDAITELLQEWRRGNRTAADRLMPRVYEELRRIAARLVCDAARDPTLSPTAVVHELYLKLEERSAVDWQSRGHFFALAARMMRQALVDHCRTQGRLKRGGERRRVSLDAAVLTAPTRPQALLELDQALGDLGRRSRRQAAVVELRYFGGLTIDETAACLGIAPKTVVREWRRARVWLYRALDAHCDSR